MIALRFSLTATLLAAGSAGAPVPDDPSGPPLPVDVMTAIPAPHKTQFKVATLPRVYFSHATRDDGTRIFDDGPYASVGLQYQLGKSTTLVGAYERYGNTAQRWGANTTNNGFSVKLDMHF